LPQQFLIYFLKYADSVREADCGNIYASADFSRPLRGLRNPKALTPSDKSLGYFQASATRTEREYVANA
jgi:hypothetical protein